MSIASSLMHDGWAFTPMAECTEDGFTSSLDRNTTVGISVLPSNYAAGLGLAKRSKAAGAKLVVLGGSYAASRATQILQNNPEVDVTVSGPGEAAFASILEGVPPEAIAGVTYRDACHAARSVPRKTLPMAERPTLLRSLWVDPVSEMLLDRSCAPVYWQDGCPVALKEVCAFCTIDHPDRITRRTSEQVVEEMKQLAALGIQAVEDGGDDFPAGGRRTIAWLQELRSRMVSEGLEFAWLIHATSRGLVFPGMIDALHGVGVRIVQIGFESGDPSLKIRLKTNSSMENRILERFRDRGMRIYGTWVMGMPGETMDSVKQTVEQIEALLESGALVGVALDPFWPGPGSPGFEMLCKLQPELRDRDYVPADELLHLWFGHFTQLKVDDVVRLREHVLASMNLPIVGGMMF